MVRSPQAFGHVQYRKAIFQKKIKRTVYNFPLNQVEMLSALRLMWLTSDASNLALHVISALLHFSVALKDFVEFHRSSVLKLQSFRLR